MVGLFRARARAKIAVALAAFALLGAGVGWLMRSPPPRITFLRFSYDGEGRRLAVFRVRNPSAQAYTFLGLGTNGICAHVRGWTGTEWAIDNMGLNFRPVALAKAGVAGPPTLLPPRSCVEIEGEVYSGMNGPLAFGFYVYPGRPEEVAQRAQELYNTDHFSLDRIRYWLRDHHLIALWQLTGNLHGGRYVWSAPIDIPPTNP